MSERSHQHRSAPAQGTQTRRHDAEGETAGRMSASQLARDGTRGAATKLPHLDAIQTAFGAAHDLSAIQAHVGGDAAGACDALGATAFASGNRVAFAQAPDLHTAAHETAHVIQQARGVNLYGGVGDAGDAYERAADEIADRVVAGRSAADLLPGRGGAAAPVGGAVQLKAKAPTEESDDERHHQETLAESGAHDAVGVKGSYLAKRIQSVAASIQKKADAIRAHQTGEVGPDGVAGMIQQELDGIGDFAQEITRLGTTIKSGRFVHGETTEILARVNDAMRLLNIAVASADAAEVGIDLGRYRALKQAVAALLGGFDFEVGGENRPVSTSADKRDYGTAQHDAVASFLDTALKEAHFARMGMKGEENSRLLAAMRACGQWAQEAFVVAQDVVDLKPFAKDINALAQEVQDLAEEAKARGGEVETTAAGLGTYANRLRSLLARSPH